MNNNNFDFYILIFDFEHRAKRDAIGPQWKNPWRLFNKNTGPC